ncbi:MAG: hypothetical protein KDE23_26085, partial [Caldilinea sp.]|nr:hypothetical protein [Caldilinea sp.]
HSQNRQKRSSPGGAHDVTIKCGGTHFLPKQEKFLSKKRERSWEEIFRSSQESDSHFLPGVSELIARREAPR